MEFDLRDHIRCILTENPTQAWLDHTIPFPEIILIGIPNLVALWATVSRSGSIDR